MEGVGDMKKILVADDDELLRNLIKDIMEGRGYQVLETWDGQETLDVFRKNPDVSLIILDIMMPKSNGMEVLKRIRQQSQVPILMLTALGDAESELRGFLSGANDYMTKPFHPEVLKARAENLMRMVKNEADGHLQVGDLMVDEKRCRTYVGGEEISLTHKEYQLLVYLMHNKDIVLTRNQILEKVWGFDYEGDIRTIDTHVKMLRMDLKGCGSYIKTIRGMGYLLSMEG